MICTLSSTTILKEAPGTLYNRITDWGTFRHFIKANANIRIPLKTEEGIEKAACYTKNLIQKADWMSSPNIKYGTQNRGSTLEIREMITLKWRLMRQWHAIRNAHDKRAVNRAQRELKRML